MEPMFWSHCICLDQQLLCQGPSPTLDGRSVGSLPTSSASMCSSSTNVILSSLRWPLHPFHIAFNRTIVTCDAIFPINTRSPVGKIYLLYLWLQTEREHNFPPVPYNTAEVSSSNSGGCASAPTSNASTLPSSYLPSFYPVTLPPFRVVTVV
jgi:hypothetical protein